MFHDWQQGGRNCPRVREGSCGRAKYDARYEPVIELSKRYGMWCVNSNVLRG